MIGTSVMKELKEKNESVDISKLITPKKNMTKSVAVLWIQV